MGYGTDLIGVWNALIATVQACSSFSSSNTMGGYLKDWAGVTYPICWIRPMEDDPVQTTLGDGLKQRKATFRIGIKKDGTGTKANQESMINLVGEIKDQIDGNRKLGGVTGITVLADEVKVSFSLQAEARSLVWYYVRMQIPILYSRVKT